tara:strand:- start:859 stop:1257 length:399 start_codon:yes stop_codon:yes gene_type:complete
MNFFGGKTRRHKRKSFKRRPTRSFLKRASYTFGPALGSIGLRMPRFSKHRNRYGGWDPNYHRTSPTGTTHPYRNSPRPNSTGPTIPNSTGHTRANSTRHNRPHYNSRHNIPHSNPRYIRPDTPTRRRRRVNR